MTRYWLLVVQCLSFATALVGIAPAFCFAQEKHTIRLARPVKVGDLTYVTQQDTFEATYTIKRGEEQLQQNQRKTVLDFAGLVETTSVDAKGNETGLKIGVDKFHVTADDKPQAEALKPGVVVICETKGDKSVFQSADEKEQLPKEAEQFLRRLFATATGKPTDEELFTPTDPQAVGASWPADKDLLLTRLRDFDPKLEADRISGTAKLLAAPLVDAKQWHEVEFQLKADSNWPPNPPPATVPYRGNLAVTATVRLPADPAQKATVVRTLDVRMKMFFNGKPDGQYKGLTLQFDSTEKREAKSEDRPPAKA